MKTTSSKSVGGQLPALGRPADVDGQAFALHAHAVGGRLLLRGEGARRAERIRLAPVRVDGRRRAIELDHGHRFRQRIAFGRHLLRVESVLLEVLDAVRERALGARRAAAGREEEDEEDGRAHGPTHSECGTGRGEGV